MIAILVIFTSRLCLNDFCYTRTDPMPIEACIEFAREYNENKLYTTSGAYCEEVKLAVPNEKE